MTSDCKFTRINAYFLYFLCIFLYPADHESVIIFFTGLSYYSQARVIRGSTALIFVFRETNRNPSVVLSVATEAGAMQVME